MDKRNELTDPVSVAMQQVLQAEQDASLKLSQSQRHADKIVSDARARARTIRRRTDDRISSVQVAYTEKLDEELSLLREQKEFNSKTGSVNSKNTILDKTIERLVQKLTGGNHAHSP